MDLFCYVVQGTMAKSVPFPNRSLLWLADHKDVVAVDTGGQLALLWAQASMVGRTWPRQGLLCVGF